MAQDVKVECHSGFRYGEHPLAFETEGQRHLIAAVLRQWRTPQGLYFRIITEDEKRYDLAYLEHEDRWEILLLA